MDFPAYFFKKIHGLGEGAERATSNRNSHFPHKINLLTKKKKYRPQLARYWPIWEKNWPRIAQISFYQFLRGNTNKACALKNDDFRLFVETSDSCSSGCSSGNTAYDNDLHRQQTPLFLDFWLIAHLVDRINCYECFGIGLTDKIHQLSVLVLIHYRNNFFSGGLSYAPIISLRVAPLWR